MSRPASPFPRPVERPAVGYPSSGPLTPPPDDADARRRADRLAGRVARWIGAGAVVAMLAAEPYHAFELDRFFVPKEVVLLTIAAVACWLAAGFARRDATGAGTSLDQLVDRALAGYLGVSVGSALLAPSGWLAARAVAITAAGAGLFWAAREAARRGAARHILAALVAAVAVAAATALVQAYGLHSDYFSINRAPGGTFGNRNFVAHLCAVGLPLAAYAALRSRRFAPALAAVLTTLALGAMLVLSRSRGAWLAGAVALVPLVIGVVRAATLTRVGAQHPTALAVRRDWRIRPGRLVLLSVALGVGVVAAIRLPNALDWRSESPYLDSVKGVVDYKGGSGRGRLAQWQHSAQLVAAHPVLGVGPGNWSVRYPSVAPVGDPSLTSEGTTANPWPSSDLVAIASERGLVGLAAFATVIGGLLLLAHRMVWGSAAVTVDAREHTVERAAERALAGGALGGVLAATLVAGAFDAVLLLAAPTIVVWPALGALAALAADGTRSVDPPRARRGSVVLKRIAAMGLAAGAALALGHGAAMPLYEHGGAGAERIAAVLAPGDYRIRLRAATLALGRGDCGVARREAEAAHTIAPTAGGARRVIAQCRARAARFVRPASSVPPDSARGRGIRLAAPVRPAVIVSLDPSP